MASSSKDVYRGSSVTPTDVPTSPSHSRVMDDDENDEDAFIRNRPRNNASRFTNIVNRQQRAKASQVTNISSSSGESSEEESNAPVGKKAKSVYATKHTKLSGWARGRPARPQVESESDSDELVLQMVDNKPQAARQREGAKANKKRARSSSGSLTPPPGLTAEDQALAQRVVNESLKLPAMKRQRTPPVVIEDDDFEDNLSPELAMIARKVMAGKGKQTQSTAPPVNSQTVVVKIQWMSHPDQPDDLEGKVWAFKIKRSDQFAKIVKAIVGQIPYPELVLSYENKRVFRTSTPASLNIWAEACLDACTTVTWDHLHRQREQIPTATASADAALPPIEDDIPELPADDEGDSGHFTLKLRSAGAKEVSLKVKPTATCEKVITAYLKKIPQGGKLTAAQKAAVHINFDGDKQLPSTTMADLELEDGDCLDVGGL